MCDRRTFDGRQDAGKIIPPHLGNQITRAEHVRAQHGSDTIAHGVADVIAPYGIDAADHAAFDEQDSQIAAVSQPILNFPVQRVAQGDNFCHNGAA